MIEFKIGSYPNGAPLNKNQVTAGMSGISVVTQEY